MHSYYSVNFPIKKLHGNGDILTGRGWRESKNFTMWIRHCQFCKVKPFLRPVSDQQTTFCLLQNGTTHQKQQLKHGTSPSMAGDTTRTRSEFDKLDENKVQFEKIRDKNINFYVSLCCILQKECFEFPFHSPRLH